VKLEKKIPKKLGRERNAPWRGGQYNSRGREHDKKLPLEKAKNLANREKGRKSNEKEKEAESKHRKVNDSTPVERKGNCRRMPFAQEGKKKESS